MMVVIFGLMIMFNVLALTAYVVYFSEERDRRRNSEQNAIRWGWFLGRKKMKGAFSR